MAAVVDYEYYSVNYGGDEMPPMKFYALEIRARKYIDSMTFNRIDYSKRVMEEVKLAICAVVSVINKHDSKQIVSEKTGDNSVTYVTSNISKEKEMYKEVKMYLADTGLLFRGI
ncbi:hypothetical protein [Clostridium celatum]|uniref:Uncharacterized protein n=1 Tax=Clostridium celatum DSM 1785 TaxID=545697 RepID=L1Q7J9_9CLOT|nr:hypothetical protein [Clostridium celatum]EKY23891.1 hypothetical protein HMPREF0216_02851 [Clostridium celatum DSM 1785]MCE9656521.1 hypothetical protein [Clostridium celatum]MDU3723501.1 hypothetical protein [Clostridium celatum]MDU6295536.1 hypothetical protein [Clostridium celatum]